MGVILDHDPGAIGELNSDSYCLPSSKRYSPSEQTGRTKRHSTNSSASGADSKIPSLLGADFLHALYLFGRSYRIT